MSFFASQGEDLLLRCLVQPKSSRDELVGIQDGRLKLRITAPLVDGKANAHLIRYMAELLYMPRTRVELLSGDNGKRKTLLLRGVAALPPALHSFMDSASGC